MAWSEQGTTICDIQIISQGYTKMTLITVCVQMVTRSGDDISESLIGGNKSAEEQVEDFDKVTESGVDIVLNSKLQETTLNTKSFKVYIKDYVKE